MAERADSLKSFDAYVDENGQNMGQDAPTDVARPSELQRRLASDPGGEAETARVASGRKSEGADLETEAETPAANIDRISNPKIAASETDDPVAPATAGLGKPD